MTLLTIEFIDNSCSGVFAARPNTEAYRLYGIPRDEVQVAINKLDRGLQGIYFLVNTNEAKNSKRYLYIGQAKQGPDRLLDHKQKKPEWNMAYMFLANKKDLSLQVADELESLEITRFMNSSKYDMANNRPNLADASAITKLFSASMEETLSFFGYDVEPFDTEEGPMLSDNCYVLKSLGCNAAIRYEGDEKIVLLSGSRIIKEEKEYLNSGVKALRADLLKSGGLKEEGDFYVLTKDIEFQSPSSAGAFAIGGSIDGWRCFKDSNGKTLDEIVRNK